MRIIKIIESKKWKNKLTGQYVSIYGSIPWVNDEEKSQWEIISVGFTWQLDNGTTGLGRIPAKTMSEAIEVMNNFNKARE